MDKKELISAVAEHQGIPKLKASPLVESVFANLEAALVAGEDFCIQGFGTFSVRRRAAHEGRNPATGEVIRVPETSRVVFRPSRRLNRRVASS